MARHQAQALRTALGAYKATPVCSLELDAFFLPLNIYRSTAGRRFRAEDAIQRA